MTNFWQRLKTPFTVLAPMDDVTDSVFRRIVVEAAKPDVFFTEFVSADGLVNNSHGSPLKKLEFTPEQHPIVAQIWGNDAENMGKAAKMVVGLGFDGIDINMGCPVRDVVRRGAGAGLIGDYETSGAIIKSVKRNAGKLPVSVKTRLGLNVNIAEDWCTFLLRQNISALTVHTRTAKQMSKVPAEWSKMREIVKIRDRISPATLIIGNGDVKSYKEVGAFHERYGVDGVMIGRGIFLNPWVFVKDPNPPVYTKKEHINLLLKHIELLEELCGKGKNFAVIKKFFKMYINNYQGANFFRQKLMEAQDLEEIKKLVGSQLVEKPGNQRKNDGRYDCGRKTVDRKAGNKLRCSPEKENVD